MDRVLIYSRRGACLADLRVTVERTWTQNEEGEAEFDIVTSDAACREDYLRFGNWLLVQNDKLGSWVGVIDYPQQWKRRYAHVHAYTADHVLTQRDVPRNLKWSGPSGGIFKRVLQIMNDAEPTIIQAGSIWMGGEQLPMENMSGDHLSDYLKNLADRAGAEYTFRAHPYGNNLVIYADWSHRFGAFVSTCPLEESYNLEDGENVVTIDGPFYNRLWGYGNAADEKSRPTATKDHAASLSKYGLREGSETYSDYDDVGQVKSALQNAILSQCWPRDVFNLSVLDEGTTWGHLRVGNSYPLRMWSVGFRIKTKVRVMSMYFNPTQGKVNIKTDEVQDP